MRGASLPASHRGRTAPGRDDYPDGIAATVTAKKKCCNSSPRCTNCPLVWKRLADDGLAERTGKRTWILLAGKIPKKLMKAARRP